MGPGHARSGGIGAIAGSHRDELGWLRPDDPASGDELDDGARARVVAGLALAVAAALDVRLPPLRLLEAWGPPVGVKLPRDVRATPELVGRAAGVLLGTGGRRRSGAYYTPAAVAGPVAHWTLGRIVSGGDGPVVCDPAAGGGAFLLAAADVLAGAGHEPAAVVERLHGIDLDPVAAAAAEAALALWCGGRAVPSMVVGDGLDGEGWPDRPDVVLGNPPFATPLRRAPGLEEDGGEGGTGRYADLAIRFLAVAVARVAAGGTVGMVVPLSFLAARDAAATRAAVLDGGGLDGLWTADGRLPGFASVPVGAVVARRGRAARRVRRFAGLPPVEVASAPAPRPGLASWSYLLAGRAGVPPVELGAGGAGAGDVLGRHCTVRAGFRQHYYGLAGSVVEDGRPGDHPLVTVGLLDPAACRWGRRPARYGGRRWTAPSVRHAALDPAMRRWAGTMLVPKVLVASQTHVVEAVVDVEGAWLPCTPVLTVTGPEAVLWHAAAVLLSPAVSAWAVAATAGAGRTPDVIRLRVDQVRDLPLPTDAAAWDEAAAATRSAHLAAAAGDEPTRRRHLVTAGRSSCLAYGIADARVDDLLDWWSPLV